LLRRTANISRDKESFELRLLPANPHPCYRPGRQKENLRKLSDKSRGGNMKHGTKDFIRTLGISLGLSGLIMAAASVPAVAQKKYDPGVTDTEIKIGNIMPYSGPASAYGIIGKTMSAYFRMINDNGGINGRKINFISYVDAYSPPKTV
jgi:ABC-type branched-subunit amino acid transport system substrate-binding protein